MDNNIVSFPPISNKDSKILILGTMPGIKSLEMNQYYAHPRNIFWNLVCRIFNAEIPKSYSERVELLIRNRIALWDVLRECERKGSADSTIARESPNAITEFLETHEKVRHIFFNGRMAAHYFRKHCSTELAIQTFTLPSTSPANAQKSFDQKFNEWKIIRDFALME